MDGRGELSNLCILQLQPGKPQATTCHISLVTLSTDPGHLSPRRMSDLLHILPLAVSTRVLHSHAELVHQYICAVQL